MSEQKRPAETHEFSDEEFEPRGTRFLTLVYLAIVALLFGSVYFGELLARR